MATTEGSFTVEGGKTYSIVYKTAITDADIGIEDILGNFLPGM